jgi:hypothetical protein
VTETLDFTSIQEALDLIDRGLGDMQHRELVSTNEVADLLLDVRLLLSASSAGTDDELPVPVPSS